MTKVKETVIDEVFLDTILRKEAGPNGLPLVPDFEGDTGSGGRKGLVPAPAAGDAAANKVLGASGGWVDAGIDEGIIQSYWMPNNLELAEISSVALTVGMGEGSGVFDGFNSLSQVDTGGATGANFSTVGQFSPSSSQISIWTGAPDGNSTAWSNFNVRLRIAASLLSSSGAAVRLSLRGPSSGSQTVISGMTIGHRATSGDAYDFDSTPVAVTVGGGQSFTVALSTTVLTDWITFPLDNTKDLIIAFHVTSGDLRTQAGTSSNLDLWSKSGSSEITVPNVTGYNNSSAADVGLLQGIEVTTAYSNLQVRSQSISLETAPDWARLMTFVTDNGAGINTDLLFRISRNGTDYGNLIMSERYTRPDGSKCFDSGKFSLSSIATGTTARWRVETINGKNPVVKAIGVIFGVD